MIHDERTWLADVRTVHSADDHVTGNQHCSTLYDCRIVTSMATIIVITTAIWASFQIEVDIGFEKLENGASAF